MTPVDYERFRAVITGMARLYDKEVDATLLDIYWLALLSWPVEEFEAVAASLIGSAVFMPKPAEFNAARLAAQPTAGEAWMQVLDCVKRSEYRRGKTPGGHIDHAVQAIGGWQVIGFTDEDKLGFVERRFAEAYRESQKVSSLREHVPKAIAKDEAKVALARITQRTGYVP